MGHNGFHNRMYRCGLHCCAKQPHIINRLRSNLSPRGWWRIKRGDLMQPFDQIHRKECRFPCPQLRICPPVGDAFDHVQVTTAGVLWNVSVFKHEFDVRFRHAGAAMAAEWWTYRSAHSHLYASMACCSMPFQGRDRSSSRRDSSTGANKARTVASPFKAVSVGARPWVICNMAVSLLIGRAGRRPHHRPVVWCRDGPCRNM